MSSDIARAVIERADREGPDLAIAYLILVLLGWAGGHRWYVGRGGTAVLQFLLVLMGGIGLIWVFIDLFLLPGMVETRRREIRQDAALEALAWGALAQPRSTASNA